MYLQYLCGLVRHSPDAYLDEMQTLLEERLGVEVHRATVWRALTLRNWIYNEKGTVNIVIPLESFSLNSSQFRH